MKIVVRALPTALKHAAACSLSNEDCGESISHSFTALRHAAACSLSNEDCGESISHNFEVVISIHWTGLGFTFNPIKPVILH